MIDLFGTGFGSRLLVAQISDVPLSQNLIFLLSHSFDIILDRWWLHLVLIM